MNDILMSLRYGNVFNLSVVEVSHGFSQTTIASYLLDMA